MENKGKIIINQSSNKKFRNDAYPTVLLLFILCIINLTACYQNSDNVVKQQLDSVVIEQDEAVFSSLDYQTLLGKLFDNPDFDTNETAIWEPNYYDRMTFPVSYDGKCYTNIDTIMYFIDRGNRNCACVILTTYKYGRDYFDSTKIEIGDCHFCGVPIGIVLLSENKEKKWELYRFEKAFTSLGYFGEYKTNKVDAGEIQLKEIGDKWTCLSLTQGIGGNMGEFMSYENLYSIEQYQLGGFPNSTLSCIFSYTSYYEYTSMIDEKIKTVEHSTMKILEKEANYYDIDLIVTKNGKTKTEHYKYADEYNGYIKK